MDCRKGTSLITLASAFTAGAILLAGCAKKPSPVPAAQPLIATEYATLDVLLAADAVRLGMGKAELIDVLIARPESELLEVTLHSAGLTVLIAPPSRAIPASAELSLSAHAPMIFGLHADRLALAVELREDLPLVLQALDQKAAEQYGSRSSFPPRELREWAAGQDYFNDDGLELYFHVEKTIARNAWHESGLDASFRQPQGEGDSFWFMLFPNPRAQPQPRTKPDRPIQAMYGVINPHGLPDDLMATKDELSFVLEELRMSLPRGGYWLPYL